MITEMMMMMTMMIMMILMAVISAYLCYDSTLSFLLSWEVRSFPTPQASMSGCNHVSTILTRVFILLSGIPSVHFSTSSPMPSFLFHLSWSFWRTDYFSIALAFLELWIHDEVMRKTKQKITIIMIITAILHFYLILWYHDEWWLTTSVDIENALFFFLYRRRDICATGLLATILVVLALTVGGFMDSIRIIHIRADVCTNGDSTLAENMAIMRNITRY